MLDQRHQVDPLVLADHDVIHAVTNAPLAINNSWAFINRDLVGDATALAIRSMALEPVLLATQETVQVTA